jgi:hypothetical protein
MTADQLRTLDTDDATLGTDDIRVEPHDPELLLRSEERVRFDRRWRDIQSRFIDDPRQAVQSADRLVVDVLDHLADRVATHRAALARQRDGEGERTADTEDLRLAMQRYRTLFQRLLAS